MSNSTDAAVGCDFHVFLFVYASGSGRSWGAVVAVGAGVAGYGATRHVGVVGADAPA